MASDSANTSPSIVVLGMHKSGTTLVAELLHSSGVPMVESLSSLSYDAGNKMERDATKNINIDLLDCEEKLSYNIINTLDVSTVSPADWCSGRSLVRELSASRWGFKDPRTILTLDFWLKLLEKPKLIGVFRHPAEVFQHYRRRSWIWYIRDPLHSVRIICAWSIYNSELLKTVKSNPDMLMIDYNRLMAGDESLKSLERHLGILIEDKRKVSIHRTHRMRAFEYRLAKLLVKFWFGYDVDDIYESLIKSSEF